MHFSTDENELRSIRYHRHYDGSREALMAAAVVFFGGGVAFSIIPVPLPFLLKLFLLLVSGFYAGWVVKRWVGEAKGRRRSQIDADFRESREQETQRQLAEMRARKTRAAGTRE